MILCCKSCGNCFESSNEDSSCDYCGGNMDILFTDEEVKSISKYELGKMINLTRDKYKFDNVDFNEQLWKSREYKEKVHEKESVKYEVKSHMLTTGYGFDDYKIKEYNGVISGQVVLGTGFLSEFTSSFSDFLGTESNHFSDKLEKAKDAAIQRLIEKSVSLGSNAIIGIDFDYIMFGNNMIGVVVNGTSVIIEKVSNNVIM